MPNAGKNGALRWSILVGKQKHNVQKPNEELAGRFEAIRNELMPEWIVIANIFLVEILTSKRVQDQEGIKGLKIVKGRGFLSFTDASIGVLQWSLMALFHWGAELKTKWNQIS